MYQLVDDAWSVRHTTLSVLTDFAADGVVYLELRTTPRVLAGLSKEGYVRTVLDAIAEFEASSWSGSAAQAMHTFVILSVDRRNTLAEAHEVLALARQFAGRGVVGLDLCGDPKRSGVEGLGPALDAQAREGTGLGLTVHFGEIACSGSEAELATLLSWRPDRLGHACHVGEAARRDIVARGGLGLELCLSCNVQAGMVTGGFEAHHFGEWWKVKECVVVLCVSVLCSFSQ